MEKRENYTPVFLNTVTDRVFSSTGRFGTHEYSYHYGHIAEAHCLSSRNLWRLTVSNTARP